MFRVRITTLEFFKPHEALWSA
uniref:Uncharacterized protein n=1 Tax=Lepeophtheirus salmonis TaxID=72036 RepID=A0A0K2VH48_LEPSM